MFIHAVLAEGTLFYRRVIDRAVLIFMVLFGMSSELWWQREVARDPEHATRNWFRGRLSRLLPGYWAMMAIWWLVVVLWHPPEGSIKLSVPLALASIIGYTPSIGTSWFVTLILQYILLFPLLRKSLSGRWYLLVLPLSALATWWTGWKMFDIVDVGKAILGDNIQWPGWYYHWIFGPRAVFNVVVGILFVRFFKGRMTPQLTMIAIVLTIIGEYAANVARGDLSDDIGPIRELSVIQLVDVPLALALLGIIKVLPIPEFLRRFLGWCGIWSWGIYLGHLLVQELLNIYGAHPRLSNQPARALYGIVLFLLGVPVAVVADRLRKLLFRERKAEPAVASPR